MTKRVSALFLCFCFLLQQPGFSQGVAQMAMPAYLRAISPPPNAFQPLVIRSLLVYPGTDNFEAFVDTGSSAGMRSEDVVQVSAVLMDYFKIGLRLPDSSFWVNLRPDSPDRMIDPLLEKTDMGRILLEADVNLKKDLARLTHPDTPLGREYWRKLYERASELYKAEDVQIPTATRPWIVPGEVVLGESGGGVYIYKALLKVMLAQDYIRSSEQSLETEESVSDPRQRELNAYSTELLKTAIIPRLTREINTSRKYAALRQVYFSLVLAQWYKAKCTYLLSESSIDTGDLTGLESRSPWSRQPFFDEYRRSVAQGEYSKTEHVVDAGGITVRQYVSGGAALQMTDAFFIQGIPPSGALVSITPGSDLTEKDGGVGNRKIINDDQRSFVDIYAQQYLDATLNNREYEAQQALWHARSNIKDSIDLSRLYSVLQKTKQYDQALEIINEWLVEHPADDRAHQQKIACLIHTQRYDEALEAMRSAAAASDDISLAGYISNNLGYVVRNLGRADERGSIKIPELMMKCEIWPNNPKFFLELIGHLNSSWRLAEAQEWLDRLFSIPDVDRPALSKAYCLRAEVCYKQKDIEGVKRACDSMLDLDVSNKKILSRMLALLMLINKKSLETPDKDMLLRTQRFVNRLQKSFEHDEYIINTARTIETRLWELEKPFEQFREILADIKSALKKDDLSMARSSVEILLANRTIDKKSLVVAAYLLADRKTWSFLDLEMRINDRLLEVDKNDYKTYAQRYKLLMKLAGLAETQHKSAEALSRRRAARAALEQALQIRRDPISLHMLYNHLIKEDLFEQGLQIINEILAMEPLDIMTYNQKSTCLMKLGRFAEAWQTLSEAEKLIPDDCAQDMYFQMQKIIVLRILGKYRDALNICNALDPAAKEVIRQKIFIHIAIGDIDAAMKEVDSILALDPTLHGCIYIIRQLTLRKRYHEALRIIRVLKSSNPNSISLLNHEFECYIGLGRGEAARRILKRIEGMEIDTEEYRDQVMDIQDKLVRYELLKPYMLDGVVAAKEARRGFEYSSGTGTYRRLVGHVFQKPERSIEHTSEDLDFSIGLKHSIERHMYHPSSAQYSFTGFFPMEMDAGSVRQLITDGAANLYAMRNLPDGEDILEFWPKDVYIAYVRLAGSKEFVRMVYVVTDKGEVITAYPTSGPGVFYAVGEEIVSADVASLNPHRLMVWNRSSPSHIEEQEEVKDPIFVLSAGMQTFVNDPRLQGLAPAEREQLGWLAVTRGIRTDEGQDPGYDYYYYYIRYSAWQKNLGASTIVIKIDKADNTFAGLESLRDGGMGGIDLRSAAAAGKQRFSRHAAPEYSADQLADMWQTIETGMMHGDVLFKQLADFAAACSYYHTDEYRADINTYIAMVLKREEECGLDTQSEMKEFLGALAVTRNGG